ncbi:UbiA family prenyltransferase [Polymorphobacter sp.]|uniref:UbiA family prenyltransferase n=1 Tax=Polymorphobacter sp. TaxID=1909290 RepID=UPI003F701FC6
MTESASRSAIDPGSRASAGRPLVVDLDNSLIRTDLLYEAGFAYLGDHPRGIVPLLARLVEGKAAVKMHLARHVDIDATTLPYNADVLARIEAARAAGRPVHLASASPEKFVRAVAAHLAVFDDVHFTSDGVNLGAANKARHLNGLFGEKGYDYIGDSRADLPVWRSAHSAIAIGPSSGVARQLRRDHPTAEIVPVERGSLKTWLKALRVHQYAKNMLVFVPLIVGQHLGAQDLGRALLAFIAFSLCASSVYIINDLVDLSSDRRHRSKKRRPFAAGTLALRQGAIAAPLLLLASFAVAIAVSPVFLGVLIVYFALTTAYSFSLKRKMIVDVVALAMLYTIRVVGGAAAISVTPSEWLLAFSMFMFTSLALIKRYVELAALLDDSRPDPSNRNYKVADLPIVAALAAASGFNAVTVFALYVTSPKVQTLYRHPELLWVICPILMYWIARALMMAHRRHLDDDPIVFALKDKVSRITAITIGAVLVAAVFI